MSGMEDRTRFAAGGRAASPATAGVGTASRPVTGARTRRIQIGAGAACAVASAAVLAAVWAIQAAGYPPCEICLTERLPFYLGVPLALAVAAVAKSGRDARLLSAVLAAVFLVSAGLGAYHAAVEWHLLAGPQGCTGAIVTPASVDAFREQLQTVKVVRCDAAALTVAGLSLAAWNAFASLILCGLAACGAARKWSSLALTPPVRARGRG